MSQKHTLADIANNWALWNEFVNTDATMTREEFDVLSIQYKLGLQIQSFGDRVESGSGDDHDTGRIESIKGETAFVAWDSGVKTHAHISALRPL
jgi:hypothetical protein